MTGEAMLHHYAEVRRRLYGRPETRPLPIPAPQPPPLPPTQSVDLRPGTLTRILFEVAEQHGVPVSNIIGPRRFGPIVRARIEFYFRATSETKLSLPQIGRRCGKRDHTTVLSGVRAYCRRNNLPLPRGITERDKHA